MKQLNEKQRDQIRQYLPEFKKFLDSETSVGWQKERVERRIVFTRLLGTPSEKIGLGKNLVEELSEEEFGLIIKSLWASRIWTNKDYLVNKIVRDNGFPRLKAKLKALLYGKDRIESRYDEFKRDVKGLGDSSITEILHFFDPNVYSIWNRKPRSVLPFLGMEDMLPKRVFTYSISGEEYKQCTDVLSLIREELVKNGFHNADFTDVDFYLAFIFYEVMKGSTVKIPEKGESYDFNHDEVVNQLEAIGAGLGFDVETKKQVAKGAVVDLIWSAKIGNLGIVNYVFEVQRRGSIDSLILNLQRARNNPSVQKLVVVGNPESVEKIKNEVEALSEEFRRYLAYLTVDEVEQSTEHLQGLNEVLDKLELFKREL